MDDPTYRKVIFSNVIQASQSSISGVFRLLNFDWNRRPNRVVNRKIMIECLAKDFAVQIGRDEGPAQWVSLASEPPKING